MKRILCFGDSNTWGFDVQKFFNTNIVTRFNQRWPEVLREQLAHQNCEVLMDGLNGRTTNVNDTDWPGRCGLEQLPLAIERSAPVDIVIIMLGTNDLKQRYNRTAHEIAEGIASLIDATRNAEKLNVGQNNSVAILLLGPTNVIKEDSFDGEFRGAIAKNSELGRYLKRIAQEKEIDFIDTNEVNLELATDGIHFTESAHTQLATAIVPLVKNLLAPPENTAPRKCNLHT